MIEILLYLVLLYFLVCQPLVERLEPKRVGIIRKTNYRVPTGVRGLPSGLPSINRLASMKTLGLTSGNKLGTMGALAGAGASAGLGSLASLSRVGVGSGASLAGLGGLTKLAHASDLAETQKNTYAKQLELIQLQQQMQKQARQINLMSNLMKTRHDTAMAAIRNMRM